MASAVRSEALSLDKGLPVHDVKTMDDYLLESVARCRFNLHDPGCSGGELYSGQEGNGSRSDDGATM